MAQTRVTHPRRIEDVQDQPQIQGWQVPAIRGLKVGRLERKMSMIGGVLMGLIGLRRGGIGGLGLAATGALLAYRGATGHCPVFAKLHLNTARRQEPAQPERYFAHGIHVEQSLTVNRPANELYALWKDFTKLPRFMRHLKAVEILDEKRSRWVAKAPAGWSVQWEAEIINDEPDSLIAWRSLGGVDVDNAGSVRFVPVATGQGTEVRVVLDYIPPAGKFGFMMAKIFDEDAEEQIREDLRRFKQLVETGEIATTESQPQGRCGRVPIA